MGRGSSSKGSAGTGLVLSLGIFGKYIVSTSTTMGTETELAGMSYTLDQYCSVQVGTNTTNTDPEAIVAFDSLCNGGNTIALPGPINVDQWQSCLFIQTFPSQNNTRQCLALPHAVLKP